MMSIDETARMSQNAGAEQITAENMALLCSKNVKLDTAPIQIPDITVAQVSIIACILLPRLPYLSQDGKVYKILF